MAEGIRLLLLNDLSISMMVGYLELGEIPGINKKNRNNINKQNACLFLSSPTKPTNINKLIGRNKGPADATKDNIMDRRSRDSKKV